MRISYLIFLLLFVSATQVYSKESEWSHYNFGVGVETCFEKFTHEKTTEINYTPLIQFYPKNFTIYLGPTFQTYLDDLPRYDLHGFKIGFAHIFPAKSHLKLEYLLKLELNFLSSKYNTFLFDYAIPNIPIQGTIVHERNYFSIPFAFGVRYHPVKRIYFEGNFGYKFLWSTLKDPDTFENVALYKELKGAPTDFDLSFFLAINLGFYF